MTDITDNQQKLLDLLKNKKVEIEWYPSTGKVKYLQLYGRANRPQCEKLLALRAVYGFLHCEDFGPDDIEACKSIIKDVLKKIPPL